MSIKAIRRRIFGRRTLDDRGLMQLAAREVQQLAAQGRLRDVLVTFDCDDPDCMSPEPCPGFQAANWRTADEVARRHEARS